VGRGRWRNRAVAAEVERVERTRKDRPRALSALEHGVDRLEAGGLLSTLVRHPALIDEFHEELAQITFADEALDRLRAEIVNTPVGEGLDQAGLEHHLAARGFDKTLAKVFSIKQLASAQRGHNLEEARERCRAVIARYRSRDDLHHDATVDAVGEPLGEPTQAAWERRSSAVRARLEAAGEEHVEPLVGIRKDI
jgi:hypothetical protein